MKISHASCRFGGGPNARPILWRNPGQASLPKKPNLNRQVLACLGRYFVERFTDSPFVVAYRGKKLIERYAGLDRMLVIFATSERLLRAPFKGCEGFANATTAEIFFALVDRLTDAPSATILQASSEILGKATVLDFSTKRALCTVDHQGRKAVLGVIEIRLASATDFTLGFEYQKQARRFLNEHGDYYRGRQG